jgi:hypothetical protein
MLRCSPLALLASTLAFLAACSSTLDPIASQPDQPGGDPNHPQKDAGTRHDGSTGPGEDGGIGQGDHDSATGTDGNPPPPPPPNGLYDCDWGPPAIKSLAASTSPPGGLALSNVPQFVAFGFDDNRYEDGMQWALDLIKSKQNPAGRGEHCTFDGTPARFTFFVTSQVGDTRDTLKALHARAYQEGNEVGNHTDTHATDLQANSDETRWLKEMDTCNTYLSGLGIPRGDVVGFRTPFLQYMPATFAAIAKEGFAYDCSVEHFLSATGEDWPYTLDNGQSKNSYTGNGTGNHAGLWELPVHEFMPATGWSGVTGLDYNVFCVAKMGTAQALSLLKASLDIRFKGDNRAPANRAPLFVGGHTDIYSANNSDAASCANTVQERRMVIEQFLDYALSYDPAVRVVPYAQIMRWMQNPMGLDGTRGK